MLGQQHRGAGHRRVDVHPGPERSGDLDHRCDRVERGGAGGADAEDHGRGSATGGDVGLHRRPQRVGSQRVRDRVDVDVAEVVGAEPGEQHRLGHRRVALR
jgi:hypothetical protein